MEVEAVECAVSREAALVAKRIDLDFFVRAGRRGGRKGGKATADARTPEQRSEAARNAVKARWANMTPEQRSAYMRKVRKGKKKAKAKRKKP